MAEDGRYAETFKYPPNMKSRKYQPLKRNQTKSLLPFLLRQWQVEQAASMIARTLSGCRMTESAMYLIDTNVISELRKKGKANPGVKKFFKQTGDQENRLSR